MVRRAGLIVLLLLGVAGAGHLDVSAATGTTTGVVQVSASLPGVRTFRLAAGTTHVAFHWPNRAGARVRYALSRDGLHFGAVRLVQQDETAEGRRGETFGALIIAAGVKAVRVQSNRFLPRLTLVAFADHGPAPRPLPLRQTAATSPQPSVIPRSGLEGWGADESLRFDASGREVWPSAFYPVQKIVVHHTATQNADPDPAATMRSIYYYHAITQAWGDIGYNFLIDESGRIYEGRYSRVYASGETPTGQDVNGNGVTAAHAQGYNSGTVGIALLGTLTTQDATPAARNALDHLIAWIESSHGLDPQAVSLYTNPVSGVQATLPNILGHRDVAATECPGGTLYATLPLIRSDVAVLVGSTAAPDYALAVTPSSQSVVQGAGTSYTVNITRSGSFSGGVAFTVSGLPDGATGTFTPNPATGGSSALSVTTVAAAAPGSYPLTITGTSGTLSHTVAATLVVTLAPSPDFSLSASPASRSIKRGARTTYTVTIARTGGFAGALSFAATGLPTGATASFSPNPTTTTGTSSTLTIRTTSSTTLGTFTVTITGTSGSLSRTTKVTLVVKS